MSFRIGFTAEESAIDTIETAADVARQTALPRKSVVQVHFPKRNMTLAYYNDMFDLHCGDMVFVDGKLEGLRGHVVEVNYNFKIKISDYKRVIAVVDTDVSGEFFMAGSHFVTFDRNALPVSKALTWFRAPSKDDEEFVSGSDDTVFDIDNLSEMDVDNAVAERGHQYYLDNKVRYICVDGIHGYAIVEGSEAYEVEFEYRTGEISNLTCSCFCSYNCKHEFAAMLQLSEILQRIEKTYSDKYESTDYFAAVTKGAFFSFVIDNKQSGKFTI